MTEDDFGFEDSVPPTPPDRPGFLEPIITVPLAYDTVIGIDYEGDPITLGMQVAEIMANRLIANAGKEWYPNIAAKANEVATALVTERFKEVLEREFVPTDRYGASTGEATTIGKLIVETAENWLGTESATSKSRGSYGNRTTNLDETIQQAVTREFKSSLKKTYEAAQQQVLQQIANASAAEMADQMRKAVKQVKF